MPRLGDFLGLLMSEVTIARAQADAEAVRVAEAYASDELLKHMPIPHFRLSSVKMKLALPISDVDETEDPDRPPRGAPSLAEIIDAFSETLQKLLTEAGVTLPDEVCQELVKVLEDEIARHLRPRAVSVGVVRPVDALTDAAMGFLRDPEHAQERLSAPLPETFGDDLRSAARRAVLLKFQVPGRLHVDLPQKKGSDATGEAARGVLFLELEINEEGLEWTEIRGDAGQSQWRLILE